MTTKSLTIPKEAPPLVLVAWEDAKVISDGGVWMTNRELHYDPHIFWQVGFLIKDDKQGIILGEAWHAELIGNPTQIPRGMIRSIKKLS